MKKIFTLISLAFVAFSCSNEITSEYAKVESTKSITVTASANGDGTATRVSMDNSDVYASAWSAVWNDGDALGAWVNTDGSIANLAMSAYDMEAATFTGEVSATADSIRLIYPYSTTAAVGTLYPINLSSQKDGASSIYLVSEDFATIADNATTDISMKQVGAFVVLTAKFTDAPEDMVVKSVELSDVPVSLSIDLTKKVDEDGFYGAATTGAITVSDLDYTIEDGSMQIIFNVLPFDIVSESSLSVKFNYVANGVGYTATVALTNSTGADLSIARATHNYITATCDCSSASIYEDGTENAPYLLYSAADMIAMNSNLSACYTLMNDIDLEGSESNQWTPIGSSSSSFTGVFNGRYNTIKGLYINTSSTAYNALFGYISGQAEVRNIQVEGSVTYTGTTSSSAAAGIVAYANNSKNSEPNIVANCISKVDVSGYRYVAGIIGYTKYPCFIINCGNEGSIYATSSYSAGIVAYLYTSTIVNCYNVGEISGTSSYMGGVSAYNTSTSTTYNSYNAASITSTSSSARIGGVFQNSVATCVVMDCYWNSDLCANGYYSDYNEENVYTGMSTADMQTADFVSTLNANVTKYSGSYDLCNWVYNEGGYPTLDLGYVANQIESTTGGVTFE